MGSGPPGKTGSLGHAIGCVIADVGVERCSVVLREGMMAGVAERIRQWASRLDLEAKRDLG